MRKKFSVFFIVMAFVLSCSVFFGYALVERSFSAKADFSAFAVNSEVRADIKSKSAVLMDYGSNTVLYAHNENACYPIASMCKIMTLLLAFESLDNGEFALSDNITVSETASGMGGSQVFLEANADYTVEQLLKSIVVASANDACVAVAERICGSEDAFVDKMNEKAKELGMNNTVFVNCTGLPEPGQHSSAKDVAVMFSQLIKHKDYFTFSGVWMDEIPHPEGRITQISNTNKLIKYYKGCDCGKTGYTSEAGHCLCASAIRNGMRLISVIISAPDSKTRFKETSDLFNQGFANYESKAVIEENVPLNFKAEVRGGKQADVAVISSRSVRVLSRKNEKISVETEFVPSSILKAPVIKGDLVGTVNVYENGVLIDSVEVSAAENVDAKNFFDILKDVTSKWSVAS